MNWRHLKSWLDTSERSEPLVRQVNCSKTLVRRKLRLGLTCTLLNYQSKENILILITKFVDVIIVNITVYIFVEFIFFLPIENIKYYKPYVLQNPNCNWPR